MPNAWFRFKQFTVTHAHCAMKVNTDACLLGAWATAQHPQTILDIGAGSGVIGLMLAQRYTQAHVTLVELVPACAAQCQSNADASPFSARLTCIAGAVQAMPHTNTFNLIVSNPPYFENDTPAEHDARHTARHHNSLSFTELFAAANGLLHAQGTFCIIIPEHRLPQALACAASHQLFLRQKVNVRSLPTKPITRLLLAFTREAGTCTEEVHSIQEEPAVYSAWATSLLADFYLNL